MSLLLALNQVATGVATSAQPAVVGGDDARCAPKVPHKGGRTISDKGQKRRQWILAHLKEAGPSGLTRTDLERLIPDIHAKSHWYLKELEAAKLIVRAEQEGPVQRRAITYLLVTYAGAPTP